MASSALADPAVAALLATGAWALASLALWLVYSALKNKRVRVTGAYLSGEGEEVVSNLSPGVGSLYWGFVKKYAKRVYGVLTERVHTGSISDWFTFISSWLGLLFALSIALGTIYALARWWP